MAAAKGFIVSVYDLDMAQLGERVLSLPIRIGRSSLNDLCVAHRLVSEFHARIEDVDGRLCVRDLSSKNGVLVETVGNEGAARVAAQTPVDLEPYGYEFLLSPLLRVRVRPATGHDVLGARHSQAVGSVLGNANAAAIAVSPAAALAEDQLTQGFVPQAGGTPPEPHAAAVSPAAPSPAAPSPAAVPPSTVAPPPTLPPLPGARAQAASGSSPPRPIHAAFSQTAPQGSPRSAPAALAPAIAPPSAPSPAVQPYSSVFIEPPAGSLDLPPLPASARNGGRPLHVPQPAPGDTRLSPQAPAARGTLLEPNGAAPHEPPRLAHTAWEIGPGTLPAAAVQQAVRPTELPGRSIEAIALRGLRELAASLVPGQTVETAGDVVQLVTKLHDAVEMFCRCFIPVREACSRFIPTDELERAAIERCRHASPSYVAIERALEPRAVAAALLDWHNDNQDAPRAVEHILADLMLHHLALAQAALEGTRALLDELSPARIEGQQPVASPTMLSRLGLASTREKELWEAFARRHADLETLGRTFRALFGDTFTRAYMAQAPTPGSGPSY